MKVVRELGLKRCETVWSLSVVRLKIDWLFTLVRKDWEVIAYSL